MPPKRKATVPEKGKSKVGETSSRRQRANTNLDDGNVPRFFTDEHREHFEGKWRDKKFHQERQVMIEDFPGSLLERVVHRCGWSKVVETPHAAYPTLVKEFFANFNADIDVPESSHRNQTWVRGKWIRFSPSVIDRYYELDRSAIEPLPAEPDMTLVARFLYGRDDAWPLRTDRFMLNQLPAELRLLHIFISTNIHPTTQRGRFNEDRAHLLYHLAQGHKVDLGSHIFRVLRELAASIDSQRSLVFPCLISGICLAAGVLPLPNEEIAHPEQPISKKTIERSEAQIRVHHPEQFPPLLPSTVETDMALLNRQLSQMQVTQVELGRSVGNITHLLEAMNQRQIIIEGELQRVSRQVRMFHQDDESMRHDQRTITYAYDQVHAQMLRFGSHLETMDRNVSQIARNVELLRHTCSSGQPDQPGSSTTPPSPPGSL